VTTNEVTDTTKRLQEEDMDNYSQTGKWSHISSEPTTEEDSEDWRPLCKIQETKGHVAARNYELAVHQILKRATGLL